MTTSPTPSSAGVASNSGSLRANNYRPDIDGLRAYAVMVVVLFHLDPSWLSGGFIGVDVFFVISGYLITKIIVNEKQRTGTFSYANFYTRRVRRLFPAIFVTVILSSIAAAQIFPPSMQQGYIAEAIYSLTSLSNIYFWGQAGYFDTEAITKPLLHTWSLAVEEQFYLVWPWIIAIFLAKYSWRKALIVLFILSFISYWSDIVLVRMGELDTMFFMMPPRIFEFGIGASVVWLEKIEIRRNLWAELLVGLGMIAILGSAFFLQ